MERSKALLTTPGVVSSAGKLCAVFSANRTIMTSVETVLGSAGKQTIGKLSILQEAEERLALAIASFGSFGSTAGQF